MIVKVQGGESGSCTGAPRTARRHDIGGSRLAAEAVTYPERGTKRATRAFRPEGRCEIKLFKKYTFANDLRRRKVKDESHLGACNEMYGGCSVLAKRP